MSALTPEVRELLQAVLDAVDVPLPAHTDDDVDAHNQLLRARAADVRIQLRSALREPSLFTLAEVAEHLREWTARLPVTYTPWERTAQDGGQS